MAVDTEADYIKIWPDRKTMLKAIVRIHDDGEGIAPEVLPHIFDRFFSTRKGGAGIGLSLAKEIVSLHKGTISASYDGGAVFEITLPLR